MDSQGVSSDTSSRLNGVSNFVAAITIVPQKRTKRINSDINSANLMIGYQSPNQFAKSFKRHVESKLVFQFQKVE